MIALPRQEGRHPLRRPQSDRLLAFIKFKTMDNSSSFAQRTAQLKEIAFQLKNAADIVLAEVQHMEAAQAGFAQKATAKTKARA